MKKLRYLFDGSFGTYYAALNQTRESCEMANLIAPSAAAQIHDSYLAAGADAILTNTFAANRYTQPERLRDILEAGLWIAGESVRRAGENGKKAVVFADIGVIRRPAEEAEAGYLENARLFLELGAKHFLFETLDAFDPLLPALALIRRACPDAEIAVSFAVSTDGYTAAGREYRALLRAAAGHADIVGLNCVCGPTHMSALARAVDPAILNGKSFLLMPNAGYPEHAGRMPVFRDNTAYFADRLCEAVENSPADCAGGCCGTTPDHIRAFAAAWRKRESASPAVTAVKERQPAAVPEEPDAFTRRLRLVELDPPVDADPSFLLSAAEQLKQAGADLLTLTDSPLGRTRADCLMLAARILRETGMPVMPHLSCRDRNRIAIKGGLLAASMEGIRQVLAVTGDNTAETAVKNVFNFNSMQLIAYIADMNRAELAASPYGIAAALNVNAANFGVELERAKKKITAGADFFLTQSVFCDEAVDNLARASEELDAPVFGGVLPVASYRNALFLANEVPGIVIPDAVLSALEGKSPEETQRISLQYAVSLIEKMKTHCTGFYLMTPLKKSALTAALTGYIKNEM